MAALTAVVAALSIAVAANFLLLLAIVRRLRMQRPAPPQFKMPTIGTRIPAFAVEDVDGQLVDDRFCKEHSEAVVAFFSDNCEPCERVKAQLVRDPLQDPLLVFVQTSTEGSRQAEFVGALAGAGARTILLDRQSDIPQRFSVSAFPTLMRVHDGIVVASSLKLADVRRGSQRSEPSSSIDRPVRAGERTRDSELVEP